MPPRSVGYRVKVENPFKIFTRLLSYIYKINTWKLFVVIVFLVLSSSLSVFAMTMLKDVINVTIPSIALDPEHSFTPLIVQILEMASLYLLGVVSTYLYNFTMIFVTQDTMKKLREDMFKHMQSLPVKYFDTRSNGEIMSNYTNDVDTLRQMISQSIPSIISSSITIVTTFIFMLTTSWVLTIVTICCIILMMIITSSIGKKSSKYFMEQQKSLSKINGFIEEMIEGQRVIKVFNYEETAKKRFDKLNSEMREANYRANRISIALMPIMNNLGYVNFAITAVVGSMLLLLSQNGNTFLPVFGIGEFVIFLMYNKTFTQPIGQMSNQINYIFLALAGATRIFALLDEKSEVDEGYVTLVNVKEENGELIEVEEETSMWAWKHPHSDGTVTLTKLMGDVVFNEVDFGYTDDKIVLHDVSLYAQPGQKIAFVGATGAGKTTITNLINRFYDVQDGKIRYDGININKIKKNDLRKSLGIVLQDTHLFSGTIKENIKYGRPNATDEEVIAAAKLANADQFINLLEKGYDTYITGDGENLSQGQRQLLAIARVAITNPPVLILDEATSSIDTWTETLVQAGMDRLMKGRTVFVIAHRLSTIRNSDCIMVLEKGHIIERGNHEDLLKLGGVYYQLHQGSFKSASGSIDDILENNKN